MCVICKFKVAIGEIKDRHKKWHVFIHVESMLIRDTNDP